MATVFIPPQLAKLTGGARTVEVRGATLRQVIDELERMHPGIRERLVEGDALRAGMAAAVDNVISGLRQPVGEKSEVHFLPALKGG